MKLKTTHIETQNIFIPLVICIGMIVFFGLYDVFIYESNSGSNSIFVYLVSLALLIGLLGFRIYEGLFNNFLKNEIIISAFRSSTSLGFGAKLKSEELIHMIKESDPEFREKLLEAMNKLISSSENKNT